MPFSFLYFRCCGQSAMDTYIHIGLRIISQSWLGVSLAQFVLLHKIVYTKIHCLKLEERKVAGGVSESEAHTISSFIGTNNERPHSVRQAPRIPKHLHSCLVGATVWKAEAVQERRHYIVYITLGRNSILKPFFPP